jgi:hypothetical protein
MLTLETSAQGGDQRSSPGARKDRSGQWLRKNLPNRRPFATKANKRTEYDESDGDFVIKLGYIESGHGF